MHKSQGVLYGFLFPGEVKASQIIHFPKWDLLVQPFCECWFLISAAASISANFFFLCGVNVSVVGKMQN